MTGENVAWATCPWDRYSFTCHPRDAPRMLLIREGDVALDFCNRFSRRCLLTPDPWSMGEPHAQREREICIYIYIYMKMYIERERQRGLVEGLISCHLASRLRASKMWSCHWLLHVWAASHEVRRASRKRQKTPYRIHMFLVQILPCSLVEWKVTGCLLHSPTEKSEGITSLCCCFGSFLHMDKSTGFDLLRWLFTCDLSCPAPPKLATCPNRKTTSTQAARPCMCVCVVSFSHFNLIQKRHAWKSPSTRSHGEVTPWSDDGIGAGLKATDCYSTRWLHEPITPCQEIY